MNDTKIEWATKTWNPVTGCNCGCHYCYARGIARRFGGQVGGKSIKANQMLHDIHKPFAVIRKNRKIIKAPFPFDFEPTFHRYRLDEPLQKKKPQNIFVSSMGDLFGPWIPDEWIQAVFNACKQAPQHRYLFLTKYPARYTDLAQKGKLPTDSNFWYGSTATNPGMKFWWSTGHNTFVSFEPLLSPFEPAEGKGGIKRIGWAIIGAMSGAGKVKYQPKKEWVDSIVDEARAAGVPVFMKDSLIPIVGEENMKRDFPWEKE